MGFLLSPLSLPSEILGFLDNNRLDVSVFNLSKSYFKTQFGILTYFDVKFKTQNSVKMLKNRKFLLFCQSTQST